MSDSSALPLSKRSNHRLSRFSSVNSEANDKRRSLRGRRSSMSVKEVVDGIEITKDVVIGEYMTRISEKNSSLIPAKIAAMEKEEEHLMNYMKKLRYESEQWDEMLENYAKSADVAKKEMVEPILLSAKRIEKVRTEYIGIKDTPPSIEIALAMKPFLQKKAESQMLQNQKLKAEIEVAEAKFRKLQELIKIQEKYLNHHNKEELLTQRAECDAILLQTESWVARHRLSERFAAAV